MIDLSVGSGVGLIGGIASVLVFEHHLSAPLAMAIGFAFGIIVWSLMGKLIVGLRIPAFIITLGGLLVFKGTFWLVIHNETIPVSTGTSANLYSLLTTYYFPRWAGFALAGLIGAALVIAKVRSRRSLRKEGFEVEDAELSFMKLFIALQAIFLAVIVMNQ